MKNIKLLLATTAMLSMGAMAAYAGVSDKGESVTINVSAGIVHAIEIDYDTIQNLYFGKLIDPINGSTVIISSSDSATQAEGSAKLVNNKLNTTYGPSQGKINFVTPLTQDDIGNYHLNAVFPDTLALSNGSEKCGDVTFTHEIIGGDWGEELVGEDPEMGDPGTMMPYSYPFEGVRYGGTFTVTKNGLAAGDCSASATVTLLYTGM